MESVERYNMLIVDSPGHVSGLRVIESRAYAEAIKEDPGMIHENLGDLYSCVPVHRLADFARSVLSKDAPERVIQSVCLSDFIFSVNTGNFSSVIVGQDGIGIYVPEFHEEINRDGTSLEYGVIAALIRDRIAFHGRGGTFRKGLGGFGQIFFSEGKLRGAR